MPMRAGLRHSVGATNRYLLNYFEVVATGKYFVSLLLSSTFCFHLVLLSRMTKATQAGFGCAAGTDKNASVDLIFVFTETTSKASRLSRD